MVEPLSNEEIQQQAAKKPVKAPKVKNKKKSEAEEEELPVLLNPFACSLSYE